MMLEILRNLGYWTFVGFVFIAFVVTVIKED